MHGATAPRGFGVRVTAAGARSFIVNLVLDGRDVFKSPIIALGPEMLPRGNFDQLRESMANRVRVGSNSAVGSRGEHVGEGLKSA